MDQRSIPAEQREGSPAPAAAGVPARRRALWPWLLLAAFLGAGLWFAITQHGNRAAAQPARGQRPVMATPVVAAQARKGNIDVYFTGLGSVTPLHTVTVRSRVDGQLMRVLYSEGQSVREGELLAEIDPRPFQVQLTQAEGQLARDQAALANARLDLARYQDLIRKNAVAQQVLATQQATVAQDEGAVKTDQGNIDNAKLNLTYCQITAPVSGRIGLRLVDPGNIVHATDANGLMVITQMQPMSVIFTISEDQLQPVLRRVRAGVRLPVEAYDRAMTRRLAVGSLMTIDNEIDPTTGTLKLRAVFDNRDEALFPNQFVNARLLVQRKRGVTLVPTAAIQRNAQATYVYLVTPSQTATVRQVTLGTTEGEDSEVIFGLSPGDVVVVTGVDKLQEGSKVVVHIGGPTPGGAGQ